MRDEDGGQVAREPGAARSGSLVTVLGAGAWGTALAHLVSRNGHLVRIWSRRGESSLQQAILGETAAIAQPRIIVSAVSIKGVADLATQIQALNLPESVILVSATKGLDPTMGATPSQIWQAAFPQHPVVVFSGPNLSKEIEAGLPAATVVSSRSEAAACRVQQVFASERFRVYTNTDPLGTELGGTLKNVVAIAVGVCDGLQLGTNAKAALITRALTEMTRIGTHLGGSAATFGGLSGLGDLLATCNSPLSRNYQVGYGLAQGKSLEQVLSEIEGTAEGVNTANVLAEIALRDQITTPICHQVYLLLNDKITPQQAVEALMERDLKAER